eukprot:COSAG04_NODE_6109_length_1408_cov_1.430863_2_plen_220_part_00
MNSVLATRSAAGVPRCFSFAVPVYYGRVFGGVSAQERGRGGAAATAAAPTETPPLNKGATYLLTLEGFALLQKSFFKRKVMFSFHCFQSAASRGGRCEQASGLWPTPRRRRIWAGEGWSRPTPSLSFVGHPAAAASPSDQHQRSCPSRTGAPPEERELCVGASSCAGLAGAQACQRPRQDRRNTRPPDASCSGPPPRRHFRSKTRYNASTAPGRGADRR